MPLRLIFMGTPDFAVPTLEALVAAGHEVVAAYSQPPRPAGPQFVAAAAATVITITSAEVVAFCVYPPLVTSIALFAPTPAVTTS